jgi:phosphopantothenoylcysteine synthetase/decarboxylase
VIVANDVSSPDSGFEVPTNRAVIVGPQGVHDLGLVTKEGLAGELLDDITELLAPAT